MRVLVLSDIHGNWAALEAVAREPHDAVICLGDIVGYGPHPAACVRWVEANARWVVQGNHDHAIANQVPPRCHADFAWLAAAVSPHTATQLGADALRYLHGLPRWAFMSVDGVRIACVHAKPSDPLYGYLPPDPAAWASEVAGLEADLVLVGHTHLPHDFSINGRRVVNPGSVGQPKDGDPRASYVVLNEGHVEHRRTEYSRESTISALESSSIDLSAVDALRQMLRTGSPPAPRAGRT